jgi:hypothetical protein
MLASMEYLLLRRDKLSFFEAWLVDSELAGWHFRSLAHVYNNESSVRPFLNWMNKPFPRFLIGRSSPFLL